MNDKHSDARQPLAFDMGRVIRQWRALLDERLASLELTQAKWLPLRHLARANGTLPQRQLLELLGVEAPSLVRILDELEKQDMITRHSDPHDRRSNIICLSPRAKPLINEINARADQLREEVLAGISDADLQIVQQVLTRLLQNMGSLNT